MCGLPAIGATAPQFRLNYLLASTLYGRMPLADVLAEVRSAGCSAVDIWAEKHANHREQIETMGHEQCARLLEAHGLKIAVYSCYNREGGLPRWMQAVRRFGGDLLVIGMSGPANLQGSELRQAISVRLERLKPDIEQGAALGVRLAIENHSGLLGSPESVRVLGEAIKDQNVGIAFAPYHLPQDPELQAQLIRDLDRKVFLFYAWEFGDGSSLLPVDRQLLQLPGYGRFDFTPLLAALKAVDFRGWTSVFMHASPRGEPMLSTAMEITAAHNRARAYLESCLTRI
jgi:sugar phosphate isomerase/epimerase